MTTTARVTGPAATTTSGRLPLLVAGQSLLYGVLGVLWLFGGGGFWATVVAALCPMPYALWRMTWLLPHPIGFSAAELNAEPGIKMFGLGLGQSRAPPAW